MFYLDVSFRRQAVDQAIDGPNQIWTMLIQDLYDRIICHDTTEITHDEVKSFILKLRGLPAL